jgi:hypothetical protein
MNKLATRHKIYNSISSALACMSDGQLEQAISDGKALHKDIGGESLQIEIDNISIFVKKIPVTDLELQSDNYMSTSNIFNLPMCYQYGIGSAGLGVWRELAAHIMTSNWVLSRKIPNFPIMYHWRVLKDIDNNLMSYEEQIAFDKDSSYWENNQEINLRLKAKALSSHYIYLFLEFIPSNLYDWLNQQLSCDEDVAIRAIKLIEGQMKETNDFMSSKKFLHMDAHLKNILTDGEQLYYSDFGLALSNEFTLSDIEKKFMQDNASYDYASGSINLLHCIIANLYGKKATLKDFHENRLQLLEGKIDAIIHKYMPISLIMEKFYFSIQKDKSYLYPSDDLMNLLRDIK